MIKLCPRNLSALAGPPTPATLRSADLVVGQRPAGRPASMLLPANQQRPAQGEMSEAALRARQSAALSLFNRLDALVHQLHQWRDFFADWPQRLCQRIRRAHLERAQGARANASAPECWNGRDYTG